MPKFLHALMLVLIASILNSCDPCLGVGFTNCADEFSFRIVDKTSKADLVFSPTPTYQKDSVYLTTKLVGYSGAMSRIDVNKFTSTLLIPVDTLFLRISSTDIDTLVLTYEFMKMKCCSNKDGYGKLRSIKFNGVVADKPGNIFEFEK